KIQRWQRIIQEAAEQCQRARLPELLPIRPLADILNDISPDALAFMPWEEAHEPSLHAVLQSIQSAVSQQSTGEKMTVMLFIGPEGGLTAEEVMLAQRHTVQIVTLGQRILRAETAAIATVANVMYELGSRLSGIQ